MPMRQETFTLVPTTLVDKTTPRPPMTSKAAKKAYREATKLPRVSKSEQRRREREELARQKREYEKDRAAAKARAVREKKQLKEREERERRKKEGLPEPNRYVRASQPTIKRFVTSGLGGKRSWEEVENDDDEDCDGGLTKTHRTFDIPEKPEEGDIPSNSPKTEDHLGEFKSPLRHDLRPLLETTKGTVESAITPKPPRLDASIPPPKRLRRTYQREQAQKTRQEDQERIDRTRAAVTENEGEVALETQSLVSEEDSRALETVKSEIAHLSNVETSAGRRSHSSPSLPVVPGPPSAEKSNPNAYTRSYGKPKGETPRAMLPPPLPLHISVANKQPRKPLSDLSNNVASTPPHKWPKLASNTKRVGLQHYCAPPSSTQAFLEAHLDEFFPSPSQQIRELMDDIVDMPSNTQVAREIDLNPSPEMTQFQLPPLQLPVEAVDLSFFSSQDFVISSQDLRDIDTPSRAQSIDSLSDRHAIKPASQVAYLADSQKSSTTISEVIEQLDVAVSQVLPRPRKQPKPRFFEEKEEDLYHAALHESLMMAKVKSLASSSPKRSKRIFQRVLSTKTDDSNDEFGLDDFEVDSEFLAALDGVERKSLDNSSIPRKFRV